MNSRWTSRGPTSFFRHMGAALKVGVSLLAALTSVVTLLGAAQTAGASTVVDRGARVAFPHQIVGSSKRASRPALHRPSVTVAPRNQTVLSGTRARFTAAAVGNPTPKVRWQISTNHGDTWRNLAGATTRTLSIEATTALSGNRYRAIFTNSVGNARTRSVILLVVAPTAAPPAVSPPAVTKEPASTSVVAGASVSLTAAASGSPAPSVQWQVSTNGGGSWAAIAGAISPAYTFTASSSQNGEQFDAVFTNAAGSTTTSAATLTVSSPLGAPVITLQPQSQAVQADATATFTSSANGSPTPTVQWQYSSNGGASWTPYPGATSATLSLQAVSTFNGALFEAVFTNSAGTATSNPATLTITVGTATLSRNWAGYVDTGATFTAISAQWRVPTITCAPGETDYSAEWIGIDGGASGSNSVEQDGTESDCDGGQPSYGAWYEMYGDGAVNSGYSVTLNQPVAAGDLISAAVSYAAPTWTLTVTDLTQGWSIATPETEPTPPPAQSSAEWIVERPETCQGIGGQSCQLSNLTNFGSVTFSNASASSTSTIGTISSFSDQPVNMGQGGQVIAATGGLDPTGSTFTDIWQAA